MSQKPLERPQALLTCSRGTGASLGPRVLSKVRGQSFGKASRHLSIMSRWESPGGPGGRALRSQLDAGAENAGWTPCLNRPES